jgi:hypothetical protein
MHNDRINEYNNPGARSLSSCSTRAEASVSTSLQLILLSSATATGISCLTGQSSTMLISFEFLKPGYSTSHGPRPPTRIDEASGCLQVHDSE